MLEVFAFNVLFAVFYNWMFLLLFMIAFILVKCNRNWKGIFFFGVVLEGFSLFGSISRVVRTGENLAPEELLAHAVFLAFAFIGFCLLKNIENSSNNSSTESGIVPSELDNSAFKEQADLPLSIDPPITDSAPKQTAPSADVPIAPCDPAETSNSRPNEVPTPKNRFCKYCGNLIDPETKKCTGCGKQFFKLPKPSSKKLLVVIAIIFLLSSVGGFAAYNYYKGIDAMNNQRFIEAQQYFDNLLVSDSLFPNKYAYIEAGVLMETGNYLEAYHAFCAMEEVPVPASIIDELKKEIYSEAVNLYRWGKLTNARELFIEIEDYSRSADYLFLIKCDLLPTSFTPTSTTAQSIFEKYNYVPNSEADDNYYKLVGLIGFANAGNILIENEVALKKFLTGRWEISAGYPNYYFELDENGYVYSNLPHRYSQGTYYFKSGVYTIKEKYTYDEVKTYQFTIIDKNAISVYCYEDRSVHALFRQ